METFKSERKIAGEDVALNVFPQKVKQLNELLTVGCYCIVCIMLLQCNCVCVQSGAFDYDRLDQLTAAGVNIPTPSECLNGVTNQSICMFMLQQ